MKIGVDWGCFYFIEYIEDDEQQEHDEAIILPCLL